MAFSTRTPSVRVEPPRPPRVYNVDRPLILRPPRLKPLNNTRDYAKSPPGGGAGFGNTGLDDGSSQK